MSRLESLEAKGSAVVLIPHSKALRQEILATFPGHSEPRAAADAAPGPPRGGSVRRGVVLALATAGGAGFAPIAPGTLGAAVGVGLFALLVKAGALAVFVAVVAVSGLGVWAAGEAERIFARHDDGRIVIDEVAGQLVALWPLALLLPAERALAPLPLLLGFVSFRVLDIAKPGPVRWAEGRFPGGSGVLLDDLLAGALAALVVAAVAGIAA